MNVLVAQAHGRKRAAELVHLWESSGFDLGPDKLTLVRDLKGSCVEQVARQDVAHEAPSEHGHLIAFQKLGGRLRQHASPDERDDQTAEECHLEHLSNGHLHIAWMEGVPTEGDAREFCSQSTRIVLICLPVPS